ncbi:MAG TPA: deoxyribodipyrimidine photo-lyase [Frankiaceae bacterium]|nr:deoxyribodipyrimidine photo-lyase [Frankiaceae bacterium]
MPPTVLWFRRDLRLADHPALLAARDEAGRDGSVLGLFVLDDALRSPSGPVRLAFLYRCLRALDEQLDGRLCIRSGDPAVVVPALAAEVGATSVHISEDFGPYGRRRDAAVETALDGSGRRLVRSGSPYAVSPGRILKGEGTPYRVYTPYYRAWKEHGVRTSAHGVRTVPWHDLAGLGGEDIPVEPDLGGTELPDAGEQAAATRLKVFLANARAYGENRNLPGRDATSRLSPYLKYGCIHPRTVLAELGDSKGEGAARGEIAWRDFYADVLFHQPGSARWDLTDALAGMRYGNESAERDDELFVAWTRGRTGYPIVDAGMRQLLAEGWMHNRVRMITASFLIKDLHLHWQRGARWFLQRLADGDLASNNHGWQWTAGTGTDAAPFFRVFNPTLQGEKFDPNGDYVRRYVPELADVPASKLHEPWTLPGGVPKGYVEPIVDHATERKESLARYQDARS